MKIAGRIADSRQNRLRFIFEVRDNAILYNGIEASRAGHEVLGRNRERWHAALRELLADWNPAERAEFARLFGRFNEAMARREKETGK